MKYNTFCWLFMCLLVFSSSCSQAEAGSSDPNVEQEILKDKKVLTVYLSRTNNTKVLAEIIHGQVGGDLIPIELENPYPEDYGKIVDQVRTENESGILPLLKTKIENMETYDVIFFGFPTWGMQLSPPMKSFLNEYDLTGKILVPFNTNAGYGLGNSIQTITQFCPESIILKEYATRGGIERDGVLFVMEGETKDQVTIDVTKWLKELRLIK